MGVIDTLRLSPREQRDLLQQLDRYEQNRWYDDGRDDPRLPYRSPAGLIVALEHPGGSSQLYLVRPRNLSAGGVGFLHGSYLHTDSRCTVLLRDANGAGHKLHGRIAWCRHVHGRAHEIGIAFHEKIDTQQFLNSCVRTASSRHVHKPEAAQAQPDTGAATESVSDTDPGTVTDADADTDADTSVPLPTLAGRVLHLGDAEDERALLRFQLGQLGVDVTCVDTADQAMQRLKEEPFDLVLTGLWLAGATGAQLAERIGQENRNLPVLVLTADPDPAIHRDARQSGCEAVLIRPYTFEALVDALRPHLGGSEHAEPTVTRLLSQQWSNTAMRPLIRQYVGRLDERVQQIEMLLDAPQPDPMLRKLCLEMKGSAGSYGFPAISEAARRLGELIEKGAPHEKLHEAHRSLRNLCEAARQGLQDADGAARRTA